MSQSDEAVRAALAMLGLDRYAGRGDVVRAYRRLAKAHHPDVSSDPDAPQRFSTITAAYRRAVGATPSGEPTVPTVSTAAAAATETPGPRQPTRTAGVRAATPLLFRATRASRRPDPLVVAGPVHVQAPRQGPPVRDAGTTSARGGA